MTEILLDGDPGSLDNAVASQAVIITLSDSSDPDQVLLVSKPFGSNSQIAYDPGPKTWSLTPDRTGSFWVRVIYGLFGSVKEARISVRTVKGLRIPSTNEFSFVSASEAIQPLYDVIDDLQTQINNAGGSSIYLWGGSYLWVDVTSQLDGSTNEFLVPNYILGTSLIQAWRNGIKEAQSLIQEIDATHIKINFPSFPLVGERVELLILVYGTNSGVRHYGKLGIDPTTPPPTQGDLYFNTVLDMEMIYDASRLKWLSNHTETLLFGRSGNTGGGSFYRGPGNRAYSSTTGRNAEYNGTVIAITYTRADSDAATFEATVDGLSIATLASSSNKGEDLSLNADFNSGQIIGVKNQSGGNTTRHVHGWLSFRWRL